MNTWPGNPTRAGGVPGAKVPLLQTLRAETKAAWTFDGPAGNTDRTGNGWDIVNPPWKWAPDIRFQSRARAASGAVGSIAGDPQTPFRFNGIPFTCIFRYASRATGWTAAPQFLVGATTYNAGFQNSWELWDNGVGQLQYRCGAMDATMVQMTVAYISEPWVVCSLRRDAAMTSIRLGVDSNYETLAPAAPSPASGPLRVGNSSGPAPYTQLFLGMMADLAIDENSFMSDADVTGQVNRMLGL